jgi:hypothetical protein
MAGLLDDLEGKDKGDDKGEPKGDEPKPKKGGILGKIDSSKHKTLIQIGIGLAALIVAYMTYKAMKNAQANASTTAATTTTPSTTSTDTGTGSGGGGWDGGVAITAVWLGHRYVELGSHQPRKPALDADRERHGLPIHAGERNGSSPSWPGEPDGHDHPAEPVQRDPDPSPHQADRCPQERCHGHRQEADDHHPGRSVHSSSSREDSDTRIRHKRQSYGAGRCRTEPFHARAGRHCQHAHIVPNTYKDRGLKNSGRL